MNRSLIEVDYSPPLALLTFNRPGVLNAYNDQLLNDLSETLEEVFAKENVNALVITGCGNKSFSAGADVNWIEDLSSSEARELSRKGHLICNMMEESDTVIIAAINGYALGGGMEMALACDIRVASTRAKFGQPEVSLGMIPGFDGIRRLRELIGVGWAKELLLTGSIIDAQEAYEKGLVNRVVTPRDLIKESKDLARKIADQSSRSVGLIKKAINMEDSSSVSDFETEAFASCFEKEESLSRIQDLKEIIRD